MQEPLKPSMGIALAFSGGVGALITGLFHRAEFGLGASVCIGGLAGFRLCVAVLIWQWGEYQRQKKGIY